MDALSIGSAGTSASVSRFNAAATRIVSASPADDLTQPLVDLSNAKQDFRSSVAVIKTADDLMGTLLDMIV